MGYGEGLGFGGGSKVRGSEVQVDPVSGEEMETAAAGTGQVRESYRRRGLGFSGGDGSMRRWRRRQTAKEMWRWSVAQAKARVRSDLGEEG